jgi:hypothetical protein
MQYANYTDLAEHVGALVALLGISAGISTMLLWRMMIRMEKKVDDIGEKIGAWMLNAVKDCAACKDVLDGKYLPLKVFEDWKAEHMTMFRLWQKGRNDPGGLWDVINKIRTKIGA